MTQAADQSGAISPSSPARQNNVKRAMQSGTVAIGVGAGNVPVIIDSTADLDDAAEKICASKIFDNATSCSSENAVVILDDIYDQAIAGPGSAPAAGAAAPPRPQTSRKLSGSSGKLNRHVIAKDAAILAEVMQHGPARGRAVAQVLHGRTGGRRRQARLRRRKTVAWCSPIYRARDFEQAKKIVHRHPRTSPASATRRASTPPISTMPASLPPRPTSCAFWSTRPTPSAMAAALPIALPFTLSMGGGTWAGNTISGKPQLPPLHQHHPPGHHHRLRTNPPRKRCSATTGPGTAGESPAGRSPPLTGDPMNFEEHAAKPLLAEAGIEVPPSRLVTTRPPRPKPPPPGRSALASSRPRSPTGKRGKAGGIRLAATPEPRPAPTPRPFSACEIGNYTLSKRLLIEAQVPIAAGTTTPPMLNDPARPAVPLVLFSTMGGMDVEDSRGAGRECHDAGFLSSIRRRPRPRSSATAALAGLDIETCPNRCPRLLVRLLRASTDSLDAELVEINPLVVTQGWQPPRRPRLQAHPRRLADCPSRGTSPQPRLHAAEQTHRHRGRGGRPPA